ncbi:MAG: glycoside hydrolase family 13 protein [Saprospiraceae bacterium]|nr:glycoside hydrolase family 13 protein [Saprospiraceae bacterium]
MIFRVSFILFAISLYSCMSSSKEKVSNALAYDQPPTWAKEAIWYQIFVERFRNGNPANDPTPITSDNALIDPLPADWQLTPWGHSWYKQETWAKKTGLDFYRTIQMRRYGGDLDGVYEKIPYLKDLGINAIYFNPINDAPSLHKYDARHYHHIDVTFGDDPIADLSLMAKENHADPTTWQWTSADKKFLNLIKKLHSEGIRVILDFSWNHTGNNFWAFKDVEKNKEASPYKDWYHTKFTKDDKTGETLLEYEGWFGIKNLPELKKVDTKGKIQGHPYEGNLQPEVKKHIFEVCRRWMDPNGDGHFEDGIDGMRLDVAEHVPVGFWRDFRQFVRSVNPEFYLIGENWWTEWPDKLMDPAPWVRGDIFDAVMHYQWFKVARSYFADANDSIDLPLFRRQIDSIFLKYPEATQQAMMNLASSHDSPRLLSSFFNDNKYKFKCKPQEDAQYRTNRPGDITYHRTKLLLLHQFTFVGAPHIWNGDEMGMYGADDPDNRKPLIWPDIKFDKESQSDFSSYKYEEDIAFDQDMFDYYKSLIILRKSHPAFIYGTYRIIDVSKGKNVLAYYRIQNAEKFIVVFNNNAEVNEINLPEASENCKIVFQYGKDAISLNQTMILKPFSALVLKIEQ